MLQDEDTPELRMLDEQTSEHHLDSALMRGDGIDVALGNSTIENAVVGLGSASLNLPLLSVNKTEIQGMFVTQRWQRLYADALLETDPVKLEPIINLAEGAILDRYVDLFVAHAQTDETLDLQHAVTVLLQLRETSAIGCTSPES